MVVLKGKRLFLSAILVCISLLVSPTLNLFVFPMLAEQYQEETLNHATTLYGSLATIINILVFAFCTWNMRENKRLRLPLCLYIITQVMTVAINIIIPTITFSVTSASANISAASSGWIGSNITISTSAVIAPFASGFLLYFYMAFCRHPESGLRIGAILATLGCIINIVTGIAWVLLPLWFLNEHRATVMSAVSIWNYFGFVFSMIFWIALAMVMRKVSHTSE